MTNRRGVICDEGATRSCNCVDGRVGVSTCADGSGYGDCVCDEALPDADATLPSDDSQASDSHSSIDQPTDTEPEGLTDTGPEVGSDDDPASDEDPPSDSVSPSDSDLPPDDTEVETPEIGADCDETNPCAGELSCFAGRCMDSLGSFQWGQSLDDVINAIAIDADDNLYVAGSRREANPAATDPNDPGFQKIFVTKLSPSGVPQWSNEFGSTGSSNIVHDITVDNLDNVYVVGESRENLDGQIPEGDYRSYLYIAKYDSAGNRQWIKQSTMQGLNWQGQVSPRSNKARAVTVDANGDPWVAGTIVNNKMFFVKFAADNGEMGAVTEFCPNETYSFGNDILIDPQDSSVYVLGSDDGNALLYNFSAAGALQWQEEWKTTNDDNDSPQRMTFGADGMIYAVGHSEVDGGSDIFVTKIDPSTQSVKWTTYLEQFPSSDYGWDIAPHPESGVYITGALASDIVLVRFGTQHEWHFVARPDNSSGLDLIIDASGGSAPDESALPVGDPGDFFYDNSVGSGTGVEHGLYNKHGFDWVLVASEAVISGVPRLYRAAGAPGAATGVPGDFYADDDTGYLYEKQTYSRDLIRTLTSGDGSYATDFSEQGNGMVVDSHGNIFVAAQTTGDFQGNTNQASSNNTFDSLLLKIVP